MQRVLRKLYQNNDEILCRLLASENKRFWTSCAGLKSLNKAMDCKETEKIRGKAGDGNDSDHEDVWNVLEYESSPKKMPRNEDNAMKAKRLENVKKFIIKNEIEKLNKITGIQTRLNADGKQQRSCTGRNVFKISSIEQKHTVTSVPASLLSSSHPVRHSSSSQSSCAPVLCKSTTTTPTLNTTRNISISAPSRTLWQHNPAAYLSARSQDDLLQFAQIRSWVPTKVKQHHRSSFQFSVMSYNVLSQNLLKNHLYLYRDSPDQVLEWHYRWQGIKREIMDIQPDIVCLQEVQFKNPNHFASHFEPFFDSLGYKYCVKGRTGNKEDGCVIFYKGDLFKLDDVSSIEYRIDRVQLLDRDNVGQVCRLVPIASPATPLVIGNTHLLYNPRRSDIRLCQTALLLAELDRMARTSSGSYLPTILTGDFNSDPSSPVAQLLSAGSFHYSGKTSGNRAMPGKLLPDNLGLSDTCQWQVELQQRGLGEEVVSGTGEFKHRFGFQSVYSGRGVTTFQNRWTMVDYIMHSTNKDNKMDSQLHVVAKLALPSEQNMLSSSKFPSHICPSDHLPLVAQFSIVS